MRSGLELDDRMSASPPQHPPARVLGTGELADLVRQRDWLVTPLGPAEQWPQSLRTVVQILLTSRYAMWMGWGPELTFLYNDAYRPTLGIKHPWALGNRADQVWAEIWLDIGPRIDSVLRTGEATYDEGLLLFLERSGFREETYHTFSYSPLHDDGGKVNGMLCVVTEETERVISARRMATLRDLAAGLAAAATEAEVLSAVREQLGRNTRDVPFSIAYLFDAQGRAIRSAETGIDKSHPAACAVLENGADAPWPGGTLLLESLPPSLLVDLAAICAQAPLPTGFWDRAPQQAAIVPIRQQGNERPAGFLVVGVNPYRRYDEAYAGFVELVSGQIAAGIANARAYEEERRRAESLTELDRAKTAFFSNVSHEFRTPLTLMLGPIEDILAQPEEQTYAENRELLKVVHRNGLRLQRLVNALLDFSRLEAGRTQASFEPVDLAEFTAELASNFRSAMERAGLDFTVDCPPLSGPVHVDREMWEKIVLNLVSNAFKYTLEGSVSVRLGEQDGRAVLHIEDTGPGIPEAELPRLFERFHRVEGTHGRTHEGSGIGLALVQELVKLHGGSVSVSSVPGRGSTFTVAVPFGFGHLPPDRIGAGRALGSTALHADAWLEEALRWLPDGETAVEQTEPSVPQSGSAGGRSRVLLADDNADMRDYVRRLLGSRYDVTAVSNGEEALQAALAEPPDLVLTDVMMPGLDGFGLLAALRSHERTKTKPVLMLSARAGEESRLEGLGAGADDYLVKPFTARELLARVEAHLSLARMRREADQARRISEVRLGLVLEQNAMMAWQWEPVKDEVTSIGDVIRIFGATLRSSAEGLGFVVPEDEPEHRARVERIGREGGSYRAEFRIRRAQTHEIAWLEERATAITSEDGRVLFIVGVVADITERKRVEEEIRGKNDELMKANRELEEFAYVASHDLQEPLRMVNIYSHLLVKRFGSGEPEAAEHAEFVRQGVARMETLIKDLLTYSRAVQREEWPAGTADLAAALHDAQAVLRARIEESQAVITADSLPSVRGDTKQLAHVFQNLLSNALKYRSSERVPQVRISAQREGRQWTIAVRDNGIGFEQKHAERIFGLFKRLHADEYPGTGLGLAICQRIVERYGGRMWAEGRPGDGATFFFALPSEEKE
jgi:signal transduction histidine kinase